MLSRFDTIPERDRRTDGQTRTELLSISRDKNLTMRLWLIYVCPLTVGLNTVWRYCKQRNVT